MVLKILAAAVSAFPQLQDTSYTVPAAATLIALLATHRIAQGRATTRERDLHARVVVLTVRRPQLLQSSAAHSPPLGLTLLEDLAKRGAHVIALSPYPIESERVATYIDLLRSVTGNENIWAEECDLESPPSIHAFAKRFVLGPNGDGAQATGPGGQDRRLDALVCAHEYAGVGALPVFSARGNRDRAQNERDTRALATFLLTTLLLPAMLTAPAERDIRIVNVVNRFYAAAVPRFFSDAKYLFAEDSTTTSAPNASSSPLLPEATRALRTVLLTRHLQRVLDALPSAPPVVDPSAPPAAPTPASGKKPQQKSNIVAISVSPGLSRAETVGPLFGAGASDGWGFGRLVYILLLPLWFLFSKSAAASVQSVLHVLFLPTPSKISKSSAEKPDPLAEPEEALKPGALYAECAVVRVDVPPPEKGKEKDGAGDGDGIVPEDDGELGGERAGRAVWEAYERGLKAWEGRWDAEAYAQASERTDPRSRPSAATRDGSVAG
ncbi:hypothetical protein MVEN_00635800 [Mycena venus]|uniref:Uncharacterized protein n=1 Tax=Mycena venus TaxID=2733690 RepID=A0A8H7D655_9AGAR|nr:hypothetical protein MVEN_00635800 [Mycena venus]